MYLRVNFDYNYLSKILINKIEYLFLNHLNKITNYDKARDICCNLNIIFKVKVLDN